MASLKVETCLQKKKPPRAQTISYFRYESLNNYSEYKPSGAKGTICGYMSKPC